MENTNLRPIKLGIIDYGLGPGFTDQELHDAYYSLTQSQEDEDLLMEPITLDQFDDFYNPGFDEFEIKIEEAISFKDYSALKKGLALLARKFTAALTGDIKLTDYTKPDQLKPRKNKLFAYVSAQFNFSDGQAVKILFHSPGGDSRSFDKDEVLVSYAHSLNGRDVTHLFAEREGLSVPKFAKRMMQILEKNSPKFLSRQAKLKAKKEELEKAQKAIEGKERELAEADEQIEKKKGENEDLALKVSNLEQRIEKAQKYQKDLLKKIEKKKESSKATMDIDVDNDEMNSNDVKPEVEKKQDIAKKPPKKEKTKVVEPDTATNSEIEDAKIVAKKILEGDFDKDPATLNSKFDEILDVLEEAGEEKLLDDIEAHINSVLQKIAA